MKFRCYLILPVLLTGFYAYPQDQAKIVTWNTDDMFCLNDMNRRVELVEFGKDLNPDVLIVQEVKSLGVLEGIKNT